MFFLISEKQHGDKQRIEDVILSKRRFQYEEELKEDPRNYDVWFDYIKLEEQSKNAKRTREIYERAVEQVPPANEKRFWERYIYLWISYAIYEELTAKVRATFASSLYILCDELLTYIPVRCAYV